MRGRIYQLRVRVPAALIGCIGLKEIRLSLRTTHHREAMRRGVPLLDLLTKLFGDLRRERVTEDIVRKICGSFYDYMVNQFTPGERARRLSSTPADFIDKAPEIFGKLVERDEHWLKYGDYSHIQEALLRFADATGTAIDKQSDNYHLLLQQALLMRVEAFKLKQRRAMGHYEILAAPAAATAPAQATPTEQKHKDMTIQQLCDRFIADKHEVDGAWDEHSTLPEVKRALKTFRDILGGDDVPISVINREKMLEYKRKRSSMPNRKIKKYANLSVAEQLKMQIPEKDRISKATFNHELIWIAAMIGWAHTNELIPTNCAEKLSFSRRIQDKNRKEECLPYSKDEVSRIFEKLTYNPQRPERFWGPVIAAYSGMRLNEVAQLMVADVRKVGGVLCFKVALDINEKNGKKLKNQQSKRNIPVHDTLLQLGFEGYLKSIRASGETRLFPKLPQSKRGYGVELGKWYGREISDVLFPGSSRLKVFNSFRHSVEDYYKNIVDMRDSMQQYLVGHKTGKEDFDRYGSDPMAPILKSFVDRIDFGDLLPMLQQKMSNPVYVARGKKKTRSEETWGGSAHNRSKAAPW